MEALGAVADTVTDDRTRGRQWPVMKQRAPGPALARRPPGPPEHNGGMARIQEQVFIEVPPERVWRTVHEDLADLPRWMAYLRSAELLDGRPGPGARVRYNLELPGGFRVEVVLQYTTWTRPRQAAGRFAEGPLRGTWSYTHLPEDGGTLLRYEMDYELRGLLRFAGAMMRGQYEAGIRQGMGDLKTYLEA